MGKYVPPWYHQSTTKAGPGMVLNKTTGKYVKASDYATGSGGYSTGSNNGIPIAGGGNVLYGLPAGNNSYAPAPSNQYQDYWAGLSKLPPPNQPQNPNPNNNNGNNGNSGGRHYGGGGGGGGAGAGNAANNARVTGLANQLFNFNASPYDAMHGAITSERGQANAYNPNFQQIVAPYNQQAQTDAATSRASISQALAQAQQMNSQLGADQGAMMRHQLGDMNNAGANTAGYAGQVGNAVATRMGQLGGQNNFMGQLNALGASSLSDSLRTNGLIASGGAANLAANRGTLLNQLGERDAAIGLQQAQAQQANEQAKQEFLLKYMRV